MGTKYLIDTNTAIEYLNNTLPDAASSVIEQIESHISIITRMEMLAWPKATLAQITQLQYFISASMVFPLDEPIIIKAIDIHRSHKTKLPDAIIAATAIVHNLTIITRNKADFEKIMALNIIDPYNIR